MFSTAPAPSPLCIASYDEASPKKRRKISSATTAGGRLSRKRPHPLENISGGGIPDDIVLEICNHLEPRDLLHLAWASKHICSLLLHKSSSGVWRSSRKNDPYADKYLSKPDGMTEYGYTRLLFDKRCHFCNVSQTRNPFWAWLLRCCRKCFPEQFDECKPMIPDVEFSYYPYEPSIKTRHRVIFRRSLKNFQARLDSIDTNSEKEELLKKRASFVSSRNKRAEEERSLARVREQYRSDDIRRMRLEGWTALKLKMHAEGWEVEYEMARRNDSHMYQHCKPATPTERAWKRIEAQTMKSMLPIRSEIKARAAIVRMTYIFKNALDCYRRGRKLDEIVPEDADIAAMEPFASVLRTENPGAVEYTSFDDAIAQLPELIDQWRERADECLITAISKAEKRELEKSDLNLATTLFLCYPCGSLVSYPRILSHRCLTMGSTIIRAYSDASLRSLNRSFLFNLNTVTSRPWSLSHDADGCMSSSSGSRVAAGVLRACGMDPQTTTAEQMDARNVRLVCKCSHPTASGNFRLCMNWRKAIEHLVEKSYHETGYWMVIDGDADPLHAEYLKEARQYEINRIQSDCYNDADWACKTCIIFRGRLADVKRHLQRTHGLAGDESQYFRHLDSPPSMRSPFYINDRMLDILLLSYDARKFLK